MADPRRPFAMCLKACAVAMGTAIGLYVRVTTGAWLDNSPWPYGNPENSPRRARERMIEEIGRWNERVRRHGHGRL